MTIRHEQVFWIIVDGKGGILARDDGVSVIRKQTPWLFGSRKGANEMVEKEVGEKLVKVRLEFLT